MKNKQNTRQAFFLNNEQIKWVYDTLRSMTLKEKTGQVFCKMGFTNDEEKLHHIICEIGAGAMMYRPGQKAEIQETHRKIQNMAKIPLTLAANTKPVADLMSGYIAQPFWEMPG